MAETYTGDEGDIALAAGLDVMDGTELGSDIDAAINKTRDMIAARSNKTAVRRVMAAANTFTNETSYVDFPNAADADAMQISFEKRFTGSTLIIHMTSTAEFTSGVSQVMRLGLSIGGTDYDIAQFEYPAATNRNVIAGIREISGISAGTLTIKPRFRAGAASIIRFDTTDIVSFSVEEAF